MAIRDGDFSPGRIRDDDDGMDGPIERVELDGMMQAFDDFMARVRQDVNRELLASVLGCREDLVDDIVETWEKDRRRDRP